MGEIIRRSKGGKFIGWYLRYVDADGRRKQRASKQPSHAEARRMLVEIEARIARGAVGIEERRRCTVTFEELLRRFIEEYRGARCKDHAAYSHRARVPLSRVWREAPQIAALALSDLSSAQVARLRDVLQTRYPAGTVRTTLITVSSALSWAVREGLIEKNPASGVPRPASPASRLDFLSEGEIRRLLEEAERRARGRQLPLVWWSRWVAISLALRTGMRKGEVFGLRWQDVDLDARRLTVARSYETTPKSGKTRHLRLPSALVPLLREWREICPSKHLVCPTLRGRVWKLSGAKSQLHGLTDLLRAADCRVLPRPWHLLRHTFASHFMQSGGSLLALSQILGHTDVKVTMVYAHLGPDFLAGEIDRVRF